MSSDFAMPRASLIKLLVRAQAATLDLRSEMTKPLVPDPAF